MDREEAPEAYGATRLVRVAGPPMQDGRRWHAALQLVEHGGARLVRMDRHDAAEVPRRVERSAERGDLFGRRDARCRIESDLADDRSAPRQLGELLPVERPHGARSARVTADAPYHPRVRTGERNGRLGGGQRHREDVAGASDRSRRQGRIEMRVCVEWRARHAGGMPPTRRRVRVREGSSSAFR